MITNDIGPLLDRYVRFIGRGNMVPASLVLVDIIKRLVLEIESSDADSSPPKSTNGQQPRPYDVTAVNTTAIHCMDLPEPEDHRPELATDPDDVWDSARLVDETELEADSEADIVEHNDDTPVIDAPPVRRSRGRPRKYPQV